LFHWEKDGATREWRGPRSVVLRTIASESVQRFLRSRVSVPLCNDRQLHPTRTELFETCLLRHRASLADLLACFPLPQRASARNQRRWPSVFRFSGEAHLALPRRDARNTRCPNVSFRNRRRQDAVTDRDDGRREP